MAKCAPNSPQEKFRRYLEGMGAFSRHTVSNYLYDLGDLARFLRRRRKQLLEATREELRAYVAGLKKKLAPASLARRISAIARFYAFARGRRWLRHNPALHFPRPRVTPAEPPVPMESDVLRVLDEWKDESLVGLRTRAAMELFYGAGVRLSELTELNCDGVDERARMLRVMGKRGKERLCPVNSTALRALAAYHAARAEHLRSQGRAETPARLFTTMSGKALSPYQLRKTLKRRARAHGLKVTPHDLRRAYATHLHNRGASIEDISELLGHRRLATTQRYVRVYPDKLRAEYSRSHPRAHRWQKECRQARCDNPPAVKASSTSRARLTTAPGCTAEGWRPDTPRAPRRNRQRFSERNALPARASS